MGLDFFASNGKRSKSRVKGIPVVYTQEVKKPFYTIAHLLNLKAFHLSTRIIRANLHGTKPYYWERKYNSTIEYFRPTPQTQEESFNKTIADYKGMYSSFTYNPDYKQVLQEIKNTFPKAEFMVFTTPVSKPHLDMLFEYGLKESYKQWLKDIVDVFGNVTHFMDENEVTENYKEYFSDSHHLYPKSTDLIIKRLLNEKDETLPKDFGKMLTKENLQTYLDQI